MKLSPGDLIDRYAILTLKMKHAPEEVREEFQAYKTEFEKLWEQFEDKVNLEYYLGQLLKVNEEIWGYESDLRAGKLEEYDTSGLKDLPQEKLLQLAAVGQAAINIRNANRLRKKHINELVELTGEGFPEIKINHASEEITS